MQLLRDISDELDEIPIQEIGGELKPGMKRTFFPAETKRYVHVSRGAIIRNTKDGKNHPTCLVIDGDGKRYAFHAVILRGPSALKYSAHEEGVDANAFLVTKAGIEGYIDPDGDEPVKEVPVSETSELERPRPNIVVRGVIWLAGLLTGLRLEAWRAAKYVPVARCLLPDPPERERK